MSNYQTFGFHTASFKQWCEANFLDVKELDHHVFECGGQKFMLLSEKSGNVFDENFHFLLETGEQSRLSEPEDEIFAVVYKLGNRFYYTKVDNMDNPEAGAIKEFRYIGEPTITTPNCPFLGVHGLYEILNGSRPYSDWVAKAKFLKTDVLGLCEKNTLAGTMPFQVECSGANIKSVLGETITISSGADLFVEGKVFALNEQGWKNILQINAEINVLNPSQFVTLERLLELGEGVAFVFDPLSFSYDENVVKRFQKAFDLCYYKLDSVQYTNDSTDKGFLMRTQEYMQNKVGLKPILLCDAYYLEPEDFEIKADLNKIAGVKTHASANQYYKADDENLVLLNEVFQDKDFEQIVSVAMESLYEVADRVDFKIETGKFKLPEYLLTEEEKAQYGDASNMFDCLIAEGFEKLVADKPNVEEYLNRIEEEVDVVRTGGFVDYFLILRDIINWCHQNDILVGVGRGSAAGSLCTYLLGITQVDPLEYGLLFERFLNKGRIGKIVDATFVDVETEEGNPLVYDIETVVNIIRGGKKLRVMAQNLRVGDEIVL